MEEKKRVQTGSQKASQAKKSVKESTEHYRSNNAYRTEERRVLNSANKTPEITNGIKTQNAHKEDISTHSNVTSKTISTAQVHTGEQMSNQAVQRTVEATKQNSYQTNAYTETQAGNRIAKNTSDIYRPHVVAGNVSGIATLSSPVNSPANNATSTPIGNIQTGNQRQQEAVQRVSEANKKGSYQTNIQTGNQMEQTISRQSKLAPYQNKIVGINLSTGNVKSAIHFTENALDKSDDLGTQSVSSGMRTAEISYTGAKTAWNMSQNASEGLIKIGKGTYTTALATITIKRSVQTYLQTAEYVPVSIKDIPNMIHMNAEASGLINRPIYQGILHSVQGIQNRVDRIQTDLNLLKANLKNGKMIVIKGTRNIVDFSVKLRNGTATGKEAMALLKQARLHGMMGIKQGAVVGGKALGKGAVKSGKIALKGGKFAVTKSTPHIYGAVNLGFTNLMQSDDLGLASVGYAGKTGIATIKTGKVAVRTGIKGVKATKVTVKTGIKAGKATARGVSFIRNNGLKTAWERARYKAMKAVSKAGDSAVTALMNVIKMLGRKAMIPVLIICVIVVMVSGAIQAPIGFIGSIFSNTMETENGEQDIRSYITNPENGIPKLVENLKSEITGYLSDAQRNYDIVRYISNTGTTEPIVIGSQGELIGNFEITGYCPCRICCGKWSGGNTASGTKPTAGRTIAVDPNVIPLGTKVYFNNHTYIAEDTGGAIKGNRIDLFFNTHQEALMWGRKKNIPVYYSNNSNSDISSQVNMGFPTNEQLANMIQPIFNAVVLMNYDLELTDAQAKALLKEIFDTLFKISNRTTTEYCGQDITTGQGTPSTHSCGKIHALDNCPNVSLGKHTSYTCDTCCFRYCPGHEKTATFTVYTRNLEKWIKEHSQYTIVSTTPIIDNDNDTKNDKTKVDVKWTEYDEGCTDDCNGYKYCGGHSVITYTLNMEGAYALTAKYFINPINELSNIPNRTEEQERKLQDLKGYYEICEEYMKLVSTDFGGGMNMGDLSGVDFVNGSRPSGQRVIDLALSQVGQQGGQPYWSYYGFSSRVEWCACFVHWCMNQCGIASYPTKEMTGNNAYCQSVANWFQSNGRWGDRNFTDLVAGDTIFFDWEGDGHTDHIGLVIGRDESKVYTVEGNSGDAVKCCSYPIGSSVIYGYGLMNY